MLYALHRAAGGLVGLGPTAAGTTSDGRKPGHRGANERPGRRSASAIETQRPRALTDTDVDGEGYLTEAPPEETALTETPPGA
jgi:hypothetical protein